MSHDEPRYDDGRDESREDRRGRKERILHTRISEDLAEDLRRVAEDLRVPVLNLVRNVLEEAFSVVETVTGVESSAEINRVCKPASLSTSLTCCDG